MQVCERQAGTRSMHIQYSYNSNVSILLVSLLSRASESLRTIPFHFKKKFYTCRPILGYTCSIIMLLSYSYTCMC